mmetsp:Transcript_42647/g.105075  ORF Transcript_42647/g.105075 Transcript_42647/m.105075 type:complete len:217 (-) Transcript_42647:428-1078(-)
MSRRVPVLSRLAEHAPQQQVQFGCADGRARVPLFPPVSGCEFRGRSCATPVLTERDTDDLARYDRAGPYFRLVRPPDWHPAVHELRQAVAVEQAALCAQHSRQHGVGGHREALDTHQAPLRQLELAPDSAETCVQASREQLRLFQNGYCTLRSPGGSGRAATRRAAARPASLQPSALSASAHVVKGRQEARKCLDKTRGRERQRSAPRRPDIAWER